MERSEYHRNRLALKINTLVRKFGDHIQKAQVFRVKISPGMMRFPQSPAVEFGE